MNNRGNGSISIIIIMMLILSLIVLPMASMVFENYYVSIVSREIVDASYASLTSSFDSIDIGRSSKDKLSFESDIRDNFLEFLKYNLLLDEEMKSKKDIFSNLEIIDFVILNADSADPILGYNLVRQTIHIEMRVEFEAIFIMNHIREKKLVDIHFDYEIPIDK